MTRMPNATPSGIMPAPTGSVSVTAARVSPLRRVVGARRLTTETIGREASDLMANFACLPAGLPIALWHDAIDRRIIAELRADGRLSNVELAERYGSPVRRSLEPDRALLEPAGGRPHEVFGVGGLPGGGPVTANPSMASPSSSNEVVPAPVETVMSYTKVAVLTNL